MGWGSSYGSGGGGSSSPSVAVTSEFRAYNNNSQSIPTATYTKVQYDTENYDTNSNFDTATQTFTPSETGVYLVTARVNTFGTTGSWDRILRLIDDLNTVVTSTFQDNLGLSALSCELTDIVELNSARTYRIEWYQASGGNQVIGYGSQWDYFAIARIT